MLEDDIYAIENGQSLFGDFLDDVYSGRKFTEEYLKEPQWHEDISIETQAYWAATVHYLCNRLNIPHPSWVNKKKYCLSDPWFAARDNGMIQIFLMIDSPPEFKMRNLFISNNALERV